MMDHKIVIKDATHASTISQWFGGLQIRTALEDVGDFAKLPGFALAMAIVQREVAEMHTRAVTANLKTVAREGIDIATTAGIDLTWDKGRPVLIVKPMDLADMAEASE